MTVADRPDVRPVVETEVLHDGMVFDLVAERVALDGDGDGSADGTSPDGASSEGGASRGGAPRVVRREFVRHPGAVAVLVLDDEERVLLLSQYRHPVRRELWEAPAGLLDMTGEDARVAAARELAEEADLTAARWDVLVDYFTSPGGSDEAIRMFLARDLSPVPDDARHQREDEERDMVARWVPLDEAVTLVLSGALHNPSTVVGVLAAAAARASGWTTLRPADVPWPERPSAG
jgi:ADP-ribose pyrophosphatase